MYSDEEKPIGVEAQAEKYRLDCIIDGFIRRVGQVPECPSSDDLFDPVTTMLYYVGNYSGLDEARTLLRPHSGGGYIFQKLTDFQRKAIKLHAKRSTQTSVNELHEMKRKGEKLFSGFCDYVHEHRVTVQLESLLLNGHILNVHPGLCRRAVSCVKSNLV